MGGRVVSNGEKNIGKPLMKAYTLVVYTHVTVWRLRAQANRIEELLRGGSWGDVR